MSFKQNVGAIDRAVRLGVAILVAILYMTGVISGTVALVLGILAVVFALTSAISFCPLYTLFGLSTVGQKQ